MDRPRIVVVGGGFGGFHAARRLRQRLGRVAEITIISTTNYFLYLPLLPQIAGGVLDPRRVAVSLTSRLPGVRLVPGEVQSVDFERRRLRYVDIEERHRELGYDQLVLATGSIHKLLPVPGAAEHAHGFRGVPEALYLRDELIRQMELAGASADPAERAARTTFVVVGAGYTGTEVAAHGQLLTRAVAKRHPGLRELTPRWLLVDIADRILPELDERLARTATRVLARRGVEIRTETSVTEATEAGLVLSDGEQVPTRTLAWCVGVRPDPLVEALGLATEQGRVVVDEYLTVPGRPEVSAVGDTAAVPDLTRPGKITPMTAQHAVRQGRQVANNIAADYGRGVRKPYRHHDRGFVVDLGGIQAAANPFGAALGGPLAALVTHGYHLYSIPANRLRIALDWLLAGLMRRQTVQLGLVHGHDVPLETASPELATHRHR
ncbi:NAD(P)/FAD-dependent oxidoreductase [Natronosporangium hydrolyticum]|uniref:NAD(P)/FAD-dependent oxidoreductase n=1 Tax=Natronosporangium hydrolyticum TaxID=2811111 RepID=A0A895YFN4_9ACTN|nr:NAD(P)/FAD-dependent oxidoreductase [Natronosporangium hydrolyticum]QSB13356.1 NAD(P)/FAD-dependent oxidoreductase [Natronosporangium hydrolyticum]